MVLGDGDGGCSAGWGGAAGGGWNRDGDRDLVF